jgi:hypothetical protein
MPRQHLLVYLHNCAQDRSVPSADCFWWTFALEALQWKVRSMCAGVIKARNIREFNVSLGRRLVRARASPRVDPLCRRRVSTYIQLIESLTIFRAFPPSRRPTATNGSIAVSSRAERDGLSPADSTFVEIQYADPCDFTC